MTDFQPYQIRLIDVDSFNRFTEYLDSQHIEYTAFITCELWILITDDDLTIIKLLFSDIINYIKHY